MALQVRTPESWGIRDIQLELREISIAATVAKNCGSIFSRRESSGLLDAIQTAFDIHIQNLPSWLHDIQLTRSATILNAHMRRIRVPITMEELDISRLSGLATFVLLCCRYSENEATLIKMLELPTHRDLDMLLVVLKAMNADTPRGFRDMLRRFDARTKLREDMDRWRYKFQPVPTTVAFYLLERILPSLSEQKTEFCEVAAKVRAYRPRDWYDSRYWQPLLWLSRELLQSLDRPGLSLTDSQIRKYAHIWCAEFYLRTQVPTTPDDTCVVECLSRTRERLAPGIEFIAELCILGPAPTAPEYTEEHDDEDYQDDRFQLVAAIMLHTYAAELQAWLQAIYDYNVSLRVYDTTNTEKFFRSADISLWLMSLREQDLLVQFLEHWPFKGRAYNLPGR
ncbi:hypothetical protein F4781DRAFT_441900 [Annulohypoxylon bovei var. microspora]|nr:hypothetical protein F4781DRAFT_441900 [Annulohypoxylon bovei var. microspora]